MRVFALGCLLALVACSSTEEDPSLERLVLPSAPLIPLRVLSFNLWQEGTSVEDGYERIVDVIAASDADVVALSEVRNYDGQDLHERLCASLGERGLSYCSDYRGGDVGLLSRWPIVRGGQYLEVSNHVPGSQSVDLSEPAGGNLCCWTLRAPDGRLVRIASTHLNYENYALYLPRGYDGNSFEVIDADGNGVPEPVTDVERLHAMDLASKRDVVLRGLEFLQREPGVRDLPLVLAGDFNEASHLDWTPAMRDRYDHNGVAIEWQNSVELHQAGLRDAWRELYPDPVTHPGHTWPSTAHGRPHTTWTPLADERDRIDFVYHRGFRVVDARLVGPRTYSVRDEVVEADTECPFTLTDLPWPSDHKAVLVDLLLPSR